MAKLKFGRSEPAFDGPVRSPQAKLAAVRKAMKAALIERDDEIDLVLTAMLCREHPLLVGPPGTAKSLLLDSLMRAVPGAGRFSVLFTKFTTPEEVFGPISLSGLKEDKYRRVTTGKLPEADLSFVDEIFKASSAILNTMLRILNERVYEDGDGGYRECPLLICVAASNEWPGGEEGGKELGALFDRFLFRKKVRPIRSREGLDRLLWADTLTPEFPVTLNRAEVAAAIETAAGFSFSDPAKEAFAKIVQALREEGIQPGDRRLRKSVAACRAFTCLSGDDVTKVQPEHLEILAHTLWEDPAEQPEKCAKIVAKIANPTGAKASELLMQAEDVCAKAGGKYTEAVVKLQEVERELGRLPDDPRVTSALGVVKQRIKEYQYKVIGARAGDSRED